MGRAKRGISAIALLPSRRKNSSVDEASQELLAVLKSHGPLWNGKSPVFNTIANLLERAPVLPASWTLILYSEHLQKYQGPRDISEALKQYQAKVFANASRQLAVHPDFSEYFPLPKAGTFAATRHQQWNVVRAHMLLEAKEQLTSLRNSDLAEEGQIVRDGLASYAMRTAHGQMRGETSSLSDVSNAAFYIYSMKHGPTAAINRKLWRGGWMQSHRNSFYKATGEHLTTSMMALPYDVFDEASRTRHFDNTIASYDEDANIIGLDSQRADMWITLQKENQVALTLFHELGHASQPGGVTYQEIDQATLAQQAVRMIGAEGAVEATARIIYDQPLYSSNDDNDSGVYAVEEAMAMAVAERLGGDRMNTLSWMRMNCSDFEGVQLLADSLSNYHPEGVNKLYQAVLQADKEIFDTFPRDDTKAWDPSPSRCLVIARNALSKHLR